MKRIVLSIAFAMVCGCASSPPPQYYTLDMQPSREVTLAANLDVDRLRASEALARRDILIKTSPTEIEYYARDQWAAGLSELVSEKLESEFGQDVHGRETILLSGVILGFEQVDTLDGAEAYIKLDLEFRPEGQGRHEEPLFERVYETTLPADAPNAHAVVNALSRGLEAIAAEIMADLAELEGREPGIGRTTFP